MRVKDSFFFLIDIDIPNNNFIEGLFSYWNKSSFLEKLNSFSIPVFAWSRSGNSKDQAGLNTFCNLDELFDCCKEELLETMIYIEAGQLFMDIDIVKDGIRIFKQERPDYLTQWEHCRLPVGIGARFLSLKKTACFDVVSPVDYFKKITEFPDRFSAFYDYRKYSTYEEALLDSRYSPRIKKILDKKKVEMTWDLNGFISIFKEFRELVPRYHNTDKTIRADERKMPAPYGFESEECSEFPTYIMFDITNICNSKCSHCPHSVTYSKTGEKAVFLDLDIYRKAIDECRGKVQFVRITADGEPLLHPDLIDMIYYSGKTDNISTGLTTNGSLLLPSMAKALVDSGLFMIDISLDAIRRETYEKIRSGLSYERVMENIRYLIDYRNRASSPLKIMVSFVKQDENVGEIDDFISYWQPVADRVLIRELISNINIIKIKKDTDDRRRWPCPHWFRRIVINYNGVIKGCPIDWKNETAYISIKDTLIYDTWHSDFYRDNRLEHLNNCFSIDSICRGCLDWQGSPWGLGYEKVVNSLKKEYILDQKFKQSKKSGR